MSRFFQDLTPLSYAPESDGLAFRHYNPEEVVMGKRMEDHLRFAVAYWHSFA
ncbi:MAG: xylose isomerase, partial [Sulfitobacter geojensis]